VAVVCLRWPCRLGLGSGHCLLIFRLYTGVTGFLLALACVQNSAAPPIKHLRVINPYVVAALTDWGKVKLKGHLPLETAPAASGEAPDEAISAGTSSFGMSGVNAHMVITRPTSMKAEIKVFACVLTFSVSLPNGSCITCHKDM
jgi:acyl transferase domain-containing protein